MEIGIQDLGSLLIILALAALAVVGATLQARHEWKAVRHKIYRSGGPAVKSTRPGRVAELLASEGWESAIRGSFEEARRDLAGEAAAESLAAIEGDLPGLVTPVAREALELGEPRSRLIKLDGSILYVLALPGRPEDRRKFRGHAAFSEGWPAHAAAVRRASVGEEGPPMIALLYFLGLDGRDGRLLVAYEGREGRRYPSDLAEPSDGPGASPGLSNVLARA